MNQNSTPATAIFPPHHKATLVVGRQGTGKNLLARVLAGQHGRYIEVDAAEFLSSDASFARTLDGEPDAVIVEEADLAKAQVARLGALISNPEVQINPKHKAARMVRTPHLIFLTSAVDSINEDLLGRRFAIVRIGSDN